MTASGRGAAEETGSDSGARPVALVLDDVDSSWTQLRWWLEAPLHQTAVVFLSFQSGNEERILRERSRFLSARTGRPFIEADPHAPNTWTDATLPPDAVIWLSLLSLTGQEAIHGLHRLNHQRTQLTIRGPGCFVISDGMRLPAIAMREAADLWSIRTFSGIIGVRESPLETDRSLNSEATRDDGRATWAPPRLVVPTSLGTDSLKHLLRDLDLVYRALPHDPDRAAARVAKARETADESPVATALVAIAEAFVDGARGDGDAVSEAVSRSLAAALTLPADRFRSLLLGEIGSASMRLGGQLSVTAEVASHELQTDRALHKQQHTPETARDLSISLERVGNIAQAQGHLDQALDNYQQSLNIARDLHEQQHTPETARDLSISLNKVGDIAQAQGHLGQALDNYQQSLNIARDLHEQQHTPQTARDLSISLDNVGDIAQAQGHLDQARAAITEAAELLAAVDETLGTPESHSELQDAISRLDNMARGVN